MTAKRLLRAANRGSTSVKRTPTVRVAIGANGPPYLASAFGLGSKVSMCEGPPDSQTSSTDLALREASDAAAPEPAGSRPRANGTDAAARTKARRVTPAQVCDR